LAVAVGMGHMGSGASPFIFNDAIIGFSQSLTETANELASGLRPACDLIEEQGRRENFYLDVAGGLSVPPSVVRPPIEV
jgi:hypothetical protein